MRSLSPSVVFALAATVAGAEPTGGLQGRVFDASGQPLPGVIVEARTAGAATSTVTDASGAYDLPALEAGTYDVAFKLPSFATTLKRAAVMGGTQAVVDATLHLALSSDVLVTASRTFRNLADLDEAGDLLGVASAGSEGVVSRAQIEERPAYRVGEVLEAVPGVVISQHSGEGKANQYYVRGFNIDHGTDLATTVAGVPVNLPTHAHGQGYSDLNFLIPELVAGVQYKKGPYYADEGDFSSAGAININYLNVLDRPIARLEAGQDLYGRALAAASPRLGGGHLLLAGELLHHDGPWVHPDGFRKVNLIARYSQGGQQGGFSLTASAYDARWSATDQVPARALTSGALDRYDAIDPSDGGRTHRITLSGEWRRARGSASTEVQAYAFHYGLDLYSNFTYFLDDPVNGDQFAQRDRRWVTGLKASQRWLASWGGRDVENAVGLQVRNDAIPTVGLYHTTSRQVLGTIRQDDVTQRSGALYLQTSVQWAPKVRSVLGVRGDLYHFEVDGRDPLNSGSASAARLGPKATLVFGPWGRTELYANYGDGFHSNDGRAATLREDRTRHEPAARVSPLVRARGVELGVRTTALRHLQSTLTVWGLDIASELVFSGDAGTTEPNRPSRRVGVEWASCWSPVRWLTVDADFAWSRARFRDADPVGDRVPGAVAGVASAGVAVDSTRGFSGSVRLRYFGPRPLIEDDSVRSAASTVLSARASYRVSPRLTVSLDAFNLAGSRVGDVDYFYASRLPGEPLGGVADVHTHPLEPRSFRVSLDTSF